MVGRRRVIYRRFAFVAALLFAIAGPGNRTSAQYSQPPGIPLEPPSAANTGHMIVPGERDYELRPPLSIGPDPNVTGSINPRSELRYQLTCGRKSVRRRNCHRSSAARWSITVLQSRRAQSSSIRQYISVSRAREWQTMRYGIGVGREGFTWAGSQRISKWRSGQTGIRLTK